VTQRRSWFGWGGPSNRSDGAPERAQWAHDLVSAVEDRALWSRFGL